MNLYVSNLSFNTLNDELNQLFAEHGEVVSAKVIMDRETGRSRGFGFVEMSDSDAGNAAIKALDNKPIEGRNMSVSLAKEKSERQGGYSNKW